MVTTACNSSIGITMIINERPNRWRGMTRFNPRSGCSQAPRFSVRLVLSNAVWDQDIADATNRLDIERQLGIFFDLAPQPCYLHVDRTLKRNVQPRAQL